MKQLTWSIAACAIMLGLYVIVPVLFLTPSVSDSSVALSSDAMKDIRGAACEACTYRKWQDSGCDNNSCFRMSSSPHYSFRRIASSYYKCAASANKECDMSDPEDGYTQDCGYGAAYFSPYCHSWSRAYGVYWQYNRTCSDWSNTSC